MKIYTMWMNRKSAHDLAPELLVAIDEYSHDENPPWYQQECAKQLAECGDDVDAVRHITLNVDYQKIEGAFLDSVIEAEVG